MANADDFEEELEELCEQYVNEEGVSRDEIADRIVAVKSRLKWKRGYL